jgi:hypothetical protein
LTDLWYLKLPGLVVFRGMEDKEPQVHWSCSETLAADTLRSIDDAGTSLAELEVTFRRQLELTPTAYPVIRLDGAETAENYIGRIFECGAC